MKRWSIIIAITAFAIFAVVDTIRDFVANDTIHYFAEQPRRLLLVAFIAIGGGFAALVFDRLSLRLRRSVKLYALGSAAISLMMFTIYFLFEFAALFSQLGAPDFRRAFILMALCLSAIIFLLSFEFYQAFKKRVG